MTGLSALATALSTYLGWHYLSGLAVLGCGGGTPCDRVLQSRWSTVGGVLPVSGLAAGAYLALLLASLSIGPATETGVRRLAWRAMLVLVGAVAGSALWFTIVQKWILGAFCPYCMAAHLTGLLLAGLVSWRASLQFDDDSTDLPSKNSSAAPQASAAVPGRKASGRLPVFVPLLFGLVLAGLLAVCQAAFAPQAVYRSGQSHDRPQAVDPQSVPLVGSPQAPYVVKLLFDYKCPHCQRLHFMLNEAIRSYGGKLAFALCPTPLNRQCNSYIPQDIDEFKDSCELARVGLAVWLAKRQAFAAFDQWMFSFESGDRWHPRSLEAARARAVELVGRTNFDTASAAPWINRYLENSIRIYGDTIQNGNGAIPKLVFGSRWVIPEPNDAHDLVLILQNSLVLPKP